MKSSSTTIQMKATEQYFSVVLFITLYKEVLTFESLGEILKCDHSNESYWAVLSCGTLYYAVQGGSNVWVCGWNPKVWPFKWKLPSNTFPGCCSFFNILQKRVFWARISVSVLALTFLVVQQGKRIIENSEPTHASCSTLIFHRSPILRQNQQFHIGYLFEFYWLLYFVCKSSL